LRRRRSADTVDRVLHDLETLQGWGAALTDRAKGKGALLIARAQARSVSRVVVSQGRIEGTASIRSTGCGLQLVDDRGRSVAGSRDDLEAEPALDLLHRLVEAAAAATRLGLERGSWPAVPRARARSVPEGLSAFERIDLSSVGRELLALEREIGAAVPGTTVQISYRAELDAWRVFRSDGTDVLFAVPRCTLAARLTGRCAGERHAVSAAVFSTDPGLAADAASRALFLRRAVGAGRLALALPDAPTHPPGSFPLVIDYALAKGLAHEAFGHAAEADGFRSSILARDGRYRTGDTVGADHVSIVDEPVEGDHAWQPFSANGLPRERAVIVEHGRLLDALSDPWSAAAAGVRLTGAERAESFRHVPQPRMTNIRIEVDRPLPVHGTFEDHGPLEVRDLLERSGVLDRHPRVTYLSGYAGGQVNPASGDFVFQCKAIYALDHRGATLHRPAIFSGSMFGALGSIREAYGPLQLDAIGTCGKWGQSVPSSGGSHYFLVLEPHERVRLGGR
jgi:TldD protein